MLENLTIAVVAGLFGLLPVFLQWISDRNKSRSKNHKILRLSSELDFIERWTKLYSTGSASEASKSDTTGMKDVQNHLERILSEYSSIRTAELNQKNKPAKVSWLRRMLLLFRPSSGKGWLVHTTFYFLLIFIFAMIIAGLEEPMINPDTGENDFMYLLLGIAILFGPVLIFLQRIASRIHKRELERASEQTV